MIVVDASVLAPALADDSADGDASRASLRADLLAAPELIDLEVLSVFRRQIAVGQLAVPRAEMAVADLLAPPLRRISHRGLLLRCWELRHNLTQYDAAFVALAELFDATTGGRTSSTSKSVVGESFVQQLNHLALARFPDKGSARPEPTRHCCGGCDAVGLAGTCHP